MLKNSKAVALICGGGSVVVTVLFYLMTFDSIFTIPIRWISLMFLIFSEGIGTAKALSIRKSIFGIANIMTSIFHLGVVLTISVIFANIFPLHIKTYILLNVLTLCAMFVADVSIIYFDGYVGKKNNSLSESRAVINSLYTTARSLAIEYGDSIYKKDLEEISEMLRYSDNSALSEDEMTISGELEELQRLLAASDEGAVQKILNIKNAVKLRSLKIKNNKRGSC